MGSWSQDVGRQGGHGAEDRREQEDATLGAAGVPNNNSATIDGQPRTIVTYTDSKQVTTRPDGVTDSCWVDVKSAGREGAERAVVYDTAQLRAQREGAGAGWPDGRERGRAVILTSGDREENRPSRDLAKGSIVLHRATGGEGDEWSRWDPRLKDRQGDWRPIPAEDARAALHADRTREKER